MPSWSLLVTYLLCMGGIFLVLRQRLLKQMGESAASSNIKSISALYPNAVGLGVPVIFTLYGPQAELILMGVVVTNLIVILPLFNILMINSGEPGFYRYRNVATDPILLSILIGLILNIRGVELPQLMTSGLGMVGLLALPVILWILGASLSFYRLTELIKEKVLSLLVVKIALLPLMVLILSHYIVGLTTIETQVLVVLTSLPTGINVYLLSERYQVAKQATASVILFTTLFSLASLFGWNWIVQQLVV